VNLMLTLRNQVKIYHWETMQFSRHKSTDKLVDSLDESIVEERDPGFQWRNRWSTPLRLLYSDLGA